jgi:hypothetical protein
MPSCRDRGCVGASPYVLPERVALDALASLARRVGASAVLVLHIIAIHCIPDTHLRYFEHTYLH